MAAKTIFLLSGREGAPLPKEYLADAAITPGMLVERTTTGIKKHATAGGAAQKRFAVEDALQGKEITDDYAADARCYAILCGPGDEVYAWLAQGEVVSIGDYLESAGGGLLRKYVAQSFSSGEPDTIIPNSVVGISLETLDLGTSGDDDTRMVIEVV
jgi:hypothetical protein